MNNITVGLKKFMQNKNTVTVLGVIAAIVVLYRLLAAVVQPISEKRMINCIGNMADGASLLLQIVLTSGALFLIVIATVSNMR